MNVPLLISGFIPGKRTACLVGVILLAVTLSNAFYASAAPVQPTDPPPTDAATTTGWTPQPFSPTGHFETGFLPGGELQITNDGTLFLLYSRTIYRSTDGGAMWEPLADPSNSGSEVVLAVSPTYDQDKKVFVGLEYGSDGLCLSTDGGTSWRSPQQSVSGAIYAIAFSPNFAADQTVYAYNRSNYSLLRSMDGGEHWQGVNNLPRNSNLEQVVLSPYFATDQTLFVHLADNSLWRSFDGGATWSRADADLGTGMGNTLYDLATVPVGSETIALVAATRYALVITFDGGTTWYLISERAFRQIAVPPNFAWTLEIYGVDTNGNLFRSGDLGAHWTQMLYADPVSDLALSPNYPQDQTLYVRTESDTWVYTDSMLWVSHNGAQSWEMVSQRPDVWLEYVERLYIVASPNFDADGTVFASSKNSYEVDWILRSIDGGRKWQSIRFPQSAYRILVAVSPAFATDRTVYAMVGNQLFKSTDGGDNWVLTASSTLTSGSGSVLLLSPNYANDQAIFWGIYGQGVYRSTNDGQIWTLWTHNVPPYVKDFEISPGYPGDPTMFMTAYNDGIFRSDDGGTTWTSLSGSYPAPGFIVALSPVFHQDHTLFSAVSGGSSGGAYRSEDRGDTWINIKGGVLNRYMTNVAVSPAFAQDQTVVMTKDGEGPYMSEDAGDNWFLLPGTKKTDTGTYGRKHGLTVVYDDGRVVPLVSTPKIGVYRYRWPRLLESPPTLIGIGLEADSTAPVMRSFTLPETDGYRVVWGIDESADWLTVTPVSGTLPASATLTVDPNVVKDLVGTNTVPAVTNMTLDVYWSYYNKETFDISVRAFFIHHRVWMPLVAHGASASQRTTSLVTPLDSKSLCHFKVSECPSLEE